MLYEGTARSRRQTLGDDAISGDLPNSGLVVNERFYDVLNAVRTRTLMPEAPITASWCA